MAHSKVKTGILAATPQELLVRSKYGSEVVKGDNFTLYPPKNSNATLSSKTFPNCNKVWVGGLPKNITEDIIREIFRRFGQIEQLWIKESFGHIRFLSKASADKAISFSGYNLVIKDSENADHSGLIFVDFLQSRKDMISWDKKKNSQKIGARVTNSCTGTDLTNAFKKIKSGIGFTETLQEVTSWINRGDCNITNVSLFYDIIFIIIAFAKSAQQQKNGKNKFSSQINQIRIFFEAVYQPKVWCYLTLFQRNSIMKAYFKEIKSAFEDDLKIFYNGDDEPPAKKIKLDVDIQDKHDKLIHEIEAYKNEIIALKASHKLESDDLKRQLQSSSKSLVATNYELKLLKRKLERSEMEVAKTKQIETVPNNCLEIKLKKSHIELDKMRATKDKDIAYLQKLNEKSQAIKKQENDNKEFNELKNLYKNLQERYNNLELTLTGLQKEKSIEIELLQNKNVEEINRIKHGLIAIKNRLNKFRNPISLECVRLIAIISTFLLPFCVGANLDDILAHIRRFQINTTKEHLESLMGRCHNLFEKNSGGSWVLNIYNTTETTEETENNLMGDTLVNSLVPVWTPIWEKINLEKVIIKNISILYTSSTEANSKSIPGTNLAKEMTQFLKVVYASPTSPNVYLIQTVPLEVPLFNKQKETSPLKVPLFNKQKETSPLEVALFNKQKETSVPLEVPKETSCILDWTNRIILIKHIISLPLNLVWSETVTNAILLMRPEGVPLTEKYRILVKLEKTFRAIDIPPTTQEKMDSLKNFVFPSTFPEEINLETNDSPENQPSEISSKIIENHSLSESESTKPIKCSNIVSKRSIDNSLDYSATTLKKRKCDDDYLRRIEYKNCSASGDLNIFLEIYDGILKEGEFICEIPSESVPCSQKFVSNLKNMFKHTTIIKHLLNEIKDEDEILSKLFSLLSVQYYDIFLNIFSTLPCFKNSEISKTEHEEPKINFNEPPLVRVKLIIKHVIHAQSFLTKLEIQFKYLIEIMKVEHRVINHYKNFAANSFKYFNRLDYSLNEVTRCLDKLVKDLKLKEIMVTADQFKEMLVSIKKKNHKFEIAKDILVIIAKNIMTLKVDMHYITVLLRSLKKHLHDIMKQDYYDHRLNFKDDVILIIEHILIHFSSESFSCEQHPLNNTDIKNKSVPKRLDILSKKSRSTSMMLKTIIKKIHQTNSPEMLGKETFDDCKDIFHCIITYLSNINKSILAFRSPLEILIKKYAYENNTNYKNIDTNTSVTREFTGKLDELRAMHQSFSGTKSLGSVLSVEGMKKIQKVRLGFKNVHEFIPTLNAHLSAIKEFIKDFLDEDINKHFSILSDEYFEVIENIFRLFSFTTYLVRKSGRNVTFKDAIGCANYIKKIITSLKEQLKGLEADLIQLKLEYSCNGYQELFGSIQKYLLNLSQSLSIFLFAVVNLIDKANKTKFSGSLEELYKLYKYFSENTNSSILQDRKEISLSVLSKISLMISVRNQFSIIRLLLDSLEVELKRFSYDKKYKKRSSMLGDEYFSIIDGFITHFPESVVKKLELTKIQEENNIKIVHEPTEKRIKNLELQANEAINNLNAINLEGFPWKINKFADSKDFLKSFVVHLLNTLDFLQSIIFLSRHLSDSLSKEGAANEPLLNQLTVSALSVTNTSKQSDMSTDQNQSQLELNFTKDVSTAEHSLSDCSSNQNQERINLSSDCDNESLNGTANKKHSDKIITQNNKKQKSIQYDSCDTQNERNVNLSEIVHGEQSCSFDTQKSASDITNRINKCILHQEEADNLKVMYEAYQYFKNKQNIQFSVDHSDVIDEEFLNTMSIAVELLTKLHVTVIVVRGLVSFLKDDPNHRVYLYTLSDDYFIILNEFLYGFLTKNTFNINKNYKEAIDLELKLDEPMTHHIILKGYRRRISRLLHKLRIQFENIRMITKNDRNIFSNCQNFFQAVLLYFTHLTNPLIHFRIFFNINKDILPQIYAECNNEFPINSRMIENKYLICFTDTLNTQEYLNITTVKDQEDQSDSEFDEIKEKKPAVCCNTPKKETVNDFAKTTQNIRNELQELFEDSKSGFHHVGADQC